MTEPVLTMDTVRVTDTMRTHPLANLTGINLMCALLEADKVWSGCTTPQKSLLAELCAPVVDSLMERRSLTADDMPALPFKTGERTREALRRRGLIDSRDRLTGRAVHAWFYAVRFKQSGGDAA